MENTDVKPLSKKEKCLAWVNSHPKITILILSILFAFLTVTLSNGLTSFIYPHFRQDDIVNDPEFFYLFASLMLKGKTPYIDIFDHKGLYIFWFHALGILMGGRVGLYFLEILWFIPVYYFLALTLIEMKAGKKLGLILMVVFMAAFIAQFQGASDEEVELPFVMIPTYFYIRGYVRKEDRAFLIGTILWGVEAGVAFNLRPSDAMFGLAPAMAYAVMRFRQKKYLVLLRDAGLCIAAFLLTNLPAVIVAYSGGYFKEMWEAVIVSNFEYVGSVQTASAFKILCMVVVAVATVLGLIGLVPLYKRIDRGEWTFYLVGFAFVGTLQTLSALFCHYWIMAYPFLICYILRLVQIIPEGKPQKISVNALGSLALVAFVTMSLFWPLEYYCGGQYKNDLEAEEYVSSVISEEERELYTLCIDCEAGTYNATGIIPQTKDFAMQGWHSLMDPEIYDRLKEYVNSGYVHYVVLEDDYWTGYEYRHQIRELVTEGDFELVGTPETSATLDIYSYTGTWLTYNS